MARITIKYLCDRCSQDVTACVDCDRGSRFIERQRTPDVKYNAFYSNEAFRAARAEALKKYNETPLVSPIERVIFADPATIVYWADGTKTVVKCQEGDVFDHELGLAMAIAKRALGNTGNYNNVFKKWLPKKKKRETKTILGRVSSIKHEEGGVSATIEACATVNAREFWDSIAHGPFSGMSISFDVKEKE